MRPGGGVAPPVVIHKAEPAYTDEARNAKLQGTVVLRMVIRPDGKPHNIRVERSLGSGLDEQAIAAVQQWEFQPATKDGQPVAVLINVEIEFRIDQGSTVTPTPEGVAESAALKAVFDSLAARVVKGDFDGAYKFLSEETTKEISPNRLASRYKMLEAEHGLLQSIVFAASWTSKVTPQSPVRTGMVVARHRYESKGVLFTYLFRQEKNEWKLVGFRPGSQLPTGTVH